MGNKMAPLSGRPIYQLAAAAAIVAAVTVACAVAAAAEQQNQNDDPPAGIATKAAIVTHRNTSKIFLQRKAAHSKIFPCKENVQKSVLQ